MKTLRSRFARLAALAFLVWTSPARAQLVTYSDLVTSATNPVQRFVNISRYGQSFTAAGTGTIDTIRLNLTTTNPGTFSYSVQLWSSNGGGTPLPATLLATFVSGQSWSNNYSATIDASHLITFSSASFGQNYTVSSGNTYWLVVESDTGAARAWGTSSTPAGSAASYGPASGTWSSLSLSGGLGAEIILATVPEPSTYAVLMGSAAFALAIRARRRGAGRPVRAPSTHPSP